MNKPMPIRPSLLERAAEVYDFSAAFRAREATQEPADTAPAEDVLELTEVVAEVSSDTVIPAEAGIPLPSSERFEEKGDSRFSGNDEVGLGRSEPVAPRREGGQAIDREMLREAGFIVPETPAGQLAEEFRIVKRQLLLRAQQAEDARDRMILVCSAQPNEGKTFCAVNLALSIAGEKEVEVVLVDADIAKPEILSTLGLAGGGPGLMDAIADPSIAVESCLIDTDIPNLRVLPAGSQTHEATELLAADQTRIIVEELSVKPCRIVIFDSPPALAASPASVLALHVGQAMMVVRADRTSESDLGEALGLLSGCGDIRLLLNGVAFAARGRRFGHYYGYAG